MDVSGKVAVLGGGSFGTVLANLAASNNNKVSLWVRDCLLYTSPSPRD